MKNAFLSRVSGKSASQLISYIVGTIDAAIGRKLRIRLHALNLVGSKDYETDDNLHVLKLNRKTILGNKKDLITIPRDEVIFKSVLYDGQWEPLESKLLASAINKSKSSNICLVDVGANVGLVSRQTLNLIKKKIDVHTFEPVSTHNVCLRANLEGHENLRKFHQSQYALGMHETQATIFTEKDNKGNSSLRIDFMEDRKWDSQNINVKSSLDEFNKILLEHPNSEFLLKVDVQGYELEVLSQIPSAFFQRTSTMIIEVTSAESIDPAMIDRILESFKPFRNLRFNHPKARRISLEEVAKVWKEQSGKQRNLFISRS